MLPITGLLAALLVAAPASEAAVKAYVAAWRGDLSEARAYSAAALAKDPGDGPALFVAACVEIEEGNFPAAGALAAKLAAVQPPPPEAEVILQLAERRRSSPMERMDDSLAAAWKSAGRPDLGKTGVLRQVVESVPQGLGGIPRIEPSELRKRSPADAFLLGPLASPLRSLEPGIGGLDAHKKWAAARAVEALALAQAAESNSVALNVCLYRWLDHREARRRVASALVRAMPENGAPVLVLAVDGTVDDAPLTGPELDTILAATSKPKFSWPYSAVSAELAGVARPLDGANAEFLARELTGWCSPVSLAPLTVAHRAAATRDSELRLRASAATEAVGRRMGESGTLLDVMIGYILKRSAAKQRGDLDREAMDENAENWRVKLTTASSAAAVYAWPLASLGRQWDPEREVQFLSLLADAPVPP